MVDKIAFLFLVFSQIYHESIWQNFFEHADAEKYSIYVHAKHDFDSSSAFKQYEVPFKVPSTWHHTMRAQLALLAEAVKDPHNKKFIFLSGDSVPLQTFAYVYQELMKHDFSIFPYWWNHHQDVNSPFYLHARILKGIPAHQQYINPQWVILDRQHAEMMVADTEIISLIEQTVLDNEHHASTFLAIKGRLREVIKQENMLVVWQKGQDHPLIFNNMQDSYQRETMIEGIIRGKLFARKFDRSCNAADIQALINRYACKTDAELMVA